MQTDIFFVIQFVLSNYSMCQEGAKMNRKGYTLIELLIVIGIIGILAAIAIPGYIGQQRRAIRTEASTNLENLRLIEEQFFAENGRYTASKGVCAADNPGNIALIQTGADPLVRFRPGNSLSFSYCIENDLALNGGAQSNCFRGSAFGNTGTRVAGETYRIDCNNNRDF
jgi:prepilin-type N-terminal cleavage/methylation domain-containing protein